MSQFPDTALTVGGGNPFLPSLLEAINHADDIAIATAFIRMTGVRLIKTALEDALDRGARVRILTGDYLGVTDPYALRYLMLLQEQGADVKVFESRGKTSFHMKAYLFTRSQTVEGIEGCAFIGSSNLSHAALVSGLEWNLKVDQAEDQERFANILTEYETLYANPSCKALTHKWIDEYIKRIPDAASAPQASEPGQDEQEPPPEPNAIQKEALEALAASREQGYRRGLVVLATGLGKTWLSAFDSEQMNAKRVLFVAHREEILKQAEETFVRIRPDVKVGRYNGKEKELNVDMLFASVQTLGRTSHLNLFGREHFDYIVVDEFHHAAARTYQRLLIHFEPRFLLGLTATPERTDQSDILALCDDNLVYEKDLFHGIETKLLCPFSYYGIADEVNYQEIAWRNGKFDPKQLENQLATIARARHSFKHWEETHQSRTLAFCISKKHADFMADYFNRQGVRSASVHSESDMRRNEALSSLDEGELQVIFSVDLFNEGVDLPAIDTVLMLRPTESKIIFLQQLGRGLRNSPGTDKSKLVVLDFIGNHVSFFKKPEALFGVGVTNKARKGFLDRVIDETLTLPPGCFVNYDLNSIEFMSKLIESKVDQQEAIYRSLRESYGRRPVLVEFYRAGGAVDTIRKEYGQWLTYVEGESDLEAKEAECLKDFSDFFREVETTSLAKCFKLILLEAIIEIEGFSESPTTEALSAKSFEVLQRRRSLLVDLPEEFANQNELLGSSQNDWHKYWLKNPIKAWIGGNTSNGGAFFSVNNGKFEFKKAVPKDLYDAFAILVQELVNYRFMQYEARLASNGQTENPSSHTDNMQEVPFFTDLKIACGHFRGTAHETENIEHQSLPTTYGTLDPAKHFIARASGDSMDGGSHPIKEGDYLLLEHVGPGGGEMLDGATVAVERRDVTGEDQYLLRNVKKIGDFQYQLNAQNVNYEPTMVRENMRAFAQLNRVVDKSDLLLHQQFYKHEVAQLFGMEYKEGLWKMPGHVCPKESEDQFLFVTLNKQKADEDYKYHDYFVDDTHFHWQSQNRTTPSKEKGIGIIQSNSLPGSIYLFVRKFPKIKGRGAPFTFCGRLKYLNHTGSGPIDVDFEMETPLTTALHQFFA